MSTTSDHADAAEALERAHERLQRRRSALDADPADLEALAEAHDSITGILDRWEERATDWDDFSGYVKFRNDLTSALEETPDDVPERDAFVEAAEHVQTGGVSKTLSSADFEAAREALAPVRERLEKREAFADARSNHREAYRDAVAERRVLADRIDDLERLVRLADADLEAPVDELREPISRYDEAVAADFDAFREDAPAREVLSFLATASGYPLVDYEPPPSDLLAFVRDDAAGEHPVGQLLEYAEYSPSKLAHYVDDADRLKRRVATNRTYLERLSAAPLQVSWPPPPAGTLRRRARELVSLVGRFADEETVAALRRVRDLTRRDDYDRLQTAAVARSELTEEERRRVADGRIGSELEAARERYRELEAALEEYDV